ncbi:zinc finger protein 624-like [Culex pipiens pallens]|uniref:zinc finger protein 624-like n=1 Tax=Culex pipiens pallens TaxID=42434 RepID=UPI001953F289|nr:zinc finger protein 624-like [Culex pipiens pallens]
MDGICRCCSAENVPMKSIFHGFDEHHPLLVVITDVLRLDIMEHDGLPEQVCESCSNILLTMHASIEGFRAHDAALRKRFRVPGTTMAMAEVEMIDIKPTIVMKEEKEGDIFADDKPKARRSIKSERRASEDDDPDWAMQYDNASHNSDENEAEESEPTKQPSNPDKDMEIIMARRKRKRDPNAPKQRDYKCYICPVPSESMTPPALLEHLSSHLNEMPFTCTECVMETVVLKNVRSLNVHKKMHAQPFKCEYCDRRYSSPNARDCHVRTFHMGESAPCPSKCDECGKICNSIVALKNHMRDHKTNLRCHLCGKVFHRYSQLRYHVIRVHEKGDKYECKQCGSVVHSLESYNSHLKMHNNEKTYECNLCPMKFYTAGNLGLHKRIHAKNPNYKAKKDWTSHYTVVEDPEKGKIYTCNTCQNTFNSGINGIINHVKLHFKEIQCDQCDMKFIGKTKLKIHYVMHTRERNFMCPYCDKDFMYKPHMRYHMKTKHAEEFSADGGVAGPSKPSKKIK